jgi:hypothetical protein
VAKNNVLQLAPCLELWDAGTLAQEVFDLLPARSLVEAAVNMALLFDRFARVARQGSYGHLTEEFLHNHPSANQSDQSAHPPAEAVIS